jgi:hypothetical protein
VTAYILVAFLAAFDADGSIILKSHIKAYQSAEECVKVMEMLEEYNITQVEATGKTACYKLSKSKEPSV